MRYGVSYEESEDGFLSIIREIDFSIPFELLLQFLGGEIIYIGRRRDYRKDRETCG
ncbi:hypothetical protein GIB67_017038 [Kingdonia uniflora]|uniref:Uncharacterized protein n=1 Tax=Kingdonia uniflora TaxID=39325 RepID=A0A7J7NCE9_9MAGN|nr:hypothetical protein GIB67_017038 [Kingdonia uniflora]